MAPRQVLASGLDYLRLVTGLLQTARLANSKGGVWEAADLQWWWRRDQHRDPARQTFWIDDGAPIAAAILTDWRDRWACDLISDHHDYFAVMDMPWPRALEQIEALGDVTVEMIVPDDDDALLDQITSSGFEPTDEASVATWMRAADRPTTRPLGDGFVLAARSDRPTWVHPMIERNGNQIADRLDECSLYKPELDLAVYTTVGEVAAYGLFWADPVTGVGLVEPMRTEDGFQGRGLASCLLAGGLDRLAAHGCSVFKVSYMIGNEASRRLYLGAGFRGRATSRAYQHRT